MGQDPDNVTPLVYFALTFILTQSRNMLTKLEVFDIIYYKPVINTPERIYSLVFAEKECWSGDRKLRGGTLGMNDTECREIYDYILKRLEELKVREDIIQEIKSLKYKTVLNEKKKKQSKKNAETSAGMRQMSFIPGDEEEIDQTEVRKLTDTELLLSAMEIIKIYAATIPSMPHKIMKNLNIENIANIQWYTDDREAPDDLQLKKLNYFSLETVQENQKMIEDIINEVTADANNK